MSSQPLRWLIRSLGPEQAYRPQTAWGPIAAILATAVIIAAAPLAGYVLARSYAFAVGLGAPGAFSPGLIEARLMTHEALYVVGLNLALCGLTIAAASLFGGRAPAVLALHPPAGGWRAYGAALVIAMAATAVWFGVLLSVIPELVAEDVRPYRTLMERERSWLMPPILCLLAPVAEEVLFRGFLFSALARSRLGVVGAALISSAGWTALHVNRTELAYVQLLLSGLLLSWLLVRTGSLRIPIVVHVLFNIGVSFVVIVLQLPA